MNDTQSFNSLNSLINMDCRCPDLSLSTHFRPTLFDLYCYLTSYSLISGFVACSFYHIEWMNILWIYRLDLSLGLLILEPTSISKHQHVRFRYVLHSGGVDLIQ